MKKAVVSSVLAMVLLAGAAGAAPSSVPPPPPPDPALGPAGHALMQLDLEPAQRDKIHEILEGALHGELGELLKSFGDARHSLETSVWNPAADAALSEDSLRRLEAAGRRLLDARRALARDVMGVLDGAQQKQLLDLIAAAPPFPPPPGARPPGR